MHDGGLWLVQIQHIRYFLDGRIVAQPGAGETTSKDQQFWRELWQLKFFVVIWIDCAHLATVDSRGYDPYPVLVHCGLWRHGPHLKKKLKSRYFPPDVSITSDSVKKQCHQTFRSWSFTSRLIYPTFKKNIYIEKYIRIFSIGSQLLDFFCPFFCLWSRPESWKLGAIPIFFVETYVLVDGFGSVCVFLLLFLLLLQLFFFGCWIPRNNQTKRPVVTALLETTCETDIFLWPTGQACDQGGEPLEGWGVIGFLVPENVEKIWKNGPPPQLGKPNRIWKVIWKRKPRRMRTEFAWDFVVRFVCHFFGWMNLWLWQKPDD